MPARKIKAVEANDGSYGGMVLAAFEAQSETQTTPAIQPFLLLANAKLHFASPFGQYGKAAGPVGFLATNIKDETNAFVFTPDGKSWGGVEVSEAPACEDCGSSEGEAHDRDCLFNMDRMAEAAEEALRCNHCGNLDCKRCDALEAAGTREAEEIS